MPRVKADGWENVTTGLGVLGRDKRMTASPVVERIDQNTAEAIWRGDDMAGRIVEMPVDEMLREGFAPVIPDNKDLAEEMETEAQRLDVVEKVRTALYYQRAYGGAAILLGVDDGQPLHKPLREDRIRSFEFLTVLSPRELQPLRYYSNPLKPKYGEVSEYQLVPVDAPPDLESTAMTRIHESRLLRFDGVVTSRRAKLHNVHPGWGDSVFVRVLETVRDFQAAFGGAAVIMNDFAPPVLKIKGLAQALAGVHKDAENFATRAKAMEASRSIARVTLLDAEEEYKRETVPVTGFAEMLEKIMLRLSAAADMPVSLLMGQSPAGLNATGDSDIRWFYDRVRAKQERVLRPALVRLFSLMFANKAGPAGGKTPENWDLKFNPLWQQSPKEEAETRKIIAETDAVYVTNQVVTPEEIALSRFAGDEFSTETQIDVALRREMAAEDAHQEQRLGQPDDADARMKEAGAAEAEARAKQAAKPPAKE